MIAKWLALVVEKARTHWLLQYHHLMGLELRSHQEVNELLKFREEIMHWIATTKIEAHIISSWRDWSYLPKKQV
jgi:hypothetical protein